MTRFDMLTALMLPLLAVPVAGGPAVQYLASGKARTELQGNVPYAVRDLVPLGRAESSLAMERMILSFRMRPEAKAELEHLLLQQQDPGSAMYHQWLTPEQFKSAFGPTQAEVDQAKQWLTGQGFTIDGEARGGMSLTFSGDVARVEQAFGTAILEYQVNGVTRHANSGNPSIPAELAGSVAGVVSLHNIPRKPANSGRRAFSAPLANSTSGAHYLAPGDFATIYDLNTLYDAGIDGTGVTIAIVGRTNPGTARWTQFRSLMGLSSNTPTIIVNGTDPGSVSTDEDNEADLDVEWSGAVAPGATILFVCSKNTDSTDGVDLSAQYIVENQLASVMSTSFGSCEKDMGTTENLFYNTLWAQAASYGITSCVSSGDSGAAGCDSASATSGTARGVNGLASTPYNVCVGGTQFHEGTGSYWSTTTSSTYTSVKSYIPEVAWNESAYNGGDGLWSTGGGASILYSKPSWQVATGVPSADWRCIPDVSLSAAGHDAYLVYTVGSSGTTLYVIGGTSASSPAFAGLMALVVQKTASAQGTANAVLYPFANAQYSSGVGPFHDITSGNNTVTKVTGFSAGTGYDEATGLGSVDAALLVNGWDASVTPSVSSAGLLTGTSAVFSATVSGVTSTDLTWSTTGSATITAGSPSTTATFSAATAGTYTVTAASAVAARSANISVAVHGAHLLGTGSTVTGLDVLYLLGHEGSSGTATDLDGDGVTDADDLALLLPLLGWN